MNSEEYVFVSKALENVEKAEKYWRVRKIVTTLLAFAAAVWVAFQPSGSGRNGAYTVIILVGLMLAVCTAKIMSLMNKNTISVLRAIADLQRR
jgi:4-hydroxybenzoate polyprenyltransferase